jgi:hypothetical protein
MIAIEPQRVTALNYETGSIFINEDGQKFRVVRNTKAVVMLEPYEGRRKATYFAFMGPLPEQPTD